jgi:hypothetical protein
MSNSRIFNGHRYYEVYKGDKYHARSIAETHRSRGKLARVTPEGEDGLGRKVFKTWVK